MTRAAGEPTFFLASDGLLNKWGFNDGDEPDALLDYCDEHGIPYPTLEGWTATLRALVRERLVPALDQEIELVDVETCHNPIRARTVDGVGVEEHWTKDLPGQPALTPDGVEIPMADVIKIYCPDYPKDQPR